VRIGRGKLKPGLAITPGLTIDVTVPPPAPAAPEPEDLPLRILYEDDDIVVVDKPAGMVVHPAAGHGRGTLVNALLHHVDGLSGIGGEKRPGIVHRLDRGTTGVMVVAKHDRAHRELARQFHDREVGKEYVALVWGAMRAGQVLDAAIGRDPRQRRRMSTRSRRAKPATSKIIAVEPYSGVSLVRVTIGTGRTHQIRVHLSDAGHPVVGDAVYGGARKRLPASLSKLDRPFLHAARLTLTHPTTGKRMTFESPLPADLAAVLSAVKQSKP
jgi:23S rRNA pseudouridine1911/1915/1917 synthase